MSTCHIDQIRQQQQKGYAEGDVTYRLVVGLFSHDGGAAVVMHVLPVILLTQLAVILSSQGQQQQPQVMFVYTWPGHLSTLTLACPKLPLTLPMLRLRLSLDERTQVDMKPAGHPKQAGCGE